LPVWRPELESSQRGHTKSHVSGLHTPRYPGSTRGVRVLRGRCFEDIGPVPYWPWVQVIHSYVRDCVESRIRDEMESNAAVIAEIAPDVRVKLPDLKMLPTLDLRIRGD